MNSVSGRYLRFLYLLRTDYDYFTSTPFFHYKEKQLLKEQKKEDEDQPLLRRQSQRKRPCR